MVHTQHLAEYVADSDEQVDNASDMDEPDVPDDYIFRSYFAFTAWGPFVPINERLKILMSADEKKVMNTISATLKQSEHNKKDDERSHDSSAVRGFSTDQKINIEQLNVQKKLY